MYPPPSDFSEENSRLEIFYNPQLPLLAPDSPHFKNSIKAMGILLYRYSYMLQFSVVSKIVSLCFTVFNGCCELP